MFGWRTMGYGDICTKQTDNAIEKLREAIASADAVLIGAGAGLSTAAGFTYSGARFDRYFADFRDKYGIRDMYSGGFYPYSTLEEQWAWWSRHDYVNRYMNAPTPLYENLLKVVGEKDYFVLTTNVDHCFQKAGFDKKRMFYTQGDYGLWQCSKPCHQKTYDNEEMVREMVLSQGFQIADNGELLVPEDIHGTPDFSKIKMQVPKSLVPYCPVCGEPMTMNLRCDDTFVQDEGWYAAQNRYSDFIRRHDGLKVVFLELGVGSNTPVIIKFPFWNMTEKNKEATYVCVNFGEASCPRNIEKRSIIINGDIGEVVSHLL